MKQFINVLYRRILYKIPLKWLLIFIALFAICFASFSNAVNYVEFNYSQGQYDLKDDVFSSRSFNTYGIYCFVPQVGTNSCDNGKCANIYVNGNNYKIGGRENMYCVLGDNITITSLGGWGFHYFYVYGAYEGFKSFFPDYTSLQCQTEYNLIPISSVDSNYCTTNNLCPSQECPVGSGGVSNLYINDILHIGAPFIYMNIPQELSWDYEYTQGGTNMNIDIEGYNVDYEYMDGVVDIQNYKPNGEDLSNLVSSVLPLFVPGLVIILFLYFIFRFIKKIF